MTSNVPQTGKLTGGGTEGGCRVSSLKAVSVNGAATARPLRVQKGVRWLLRAGKDWPPLILRSG